MVHHGFGQQLVPSPDIPYVSTTAIVDFSVVNTVSANNVIQPYAAMRLWIHHPSGSVAIGGHIEYECMTFAYENPYILLIPPSGHPVSIVTWDPVKTLFRSLRRLAGEDAFLYLGQTATQTQQNQIPAPLPTLVKVTLLDGKIRRVNYAAASRSPSPRRPSSRGSMVQRDRPSSAAQQASAGNRGRSANRESSVTPTTRTLRMSWWRRLSPR